VQIVAKAMHDVIIAPPAHVQNVTEWAKREQCWELARAVQVDLAPDFVSSLVDKSVLREAEAKEKKKAKGDKGISAQVRVANLGPDYWKRLREWCQARGLLIADEDALLRMAMGIGGFPDEWRCARLLDLKMRMEGEGFPVAPDSL
jgi:hypothetical protein